MNPKLIWSEELQRFLIVSDVLTPEQLELMHVNSLRTGSHIVERPVKLTSEEIQRALQQRR